MLRLDLKAEFHYIGFHSMLNYWIAYHDTSIFTSIMYISTGHSKELQVFLTLGHSLHSPGRISSRTLSTPLGWNRKSCICHQRSAAGWAALLEFVVYMVLVYVTYWMPKHDEVEKERSQRQLIRIITFINPHSHPHQHHHHHQQQHRQLAVHPLPVDPCRWDWIVIAPPRFHLRLWILWYFLGPSLFRCFQK